MFPGEGTGECPGEGTGECPGEEGGRRLRGHWPWRSRRVRDEEIRE